MAATHAALTALIEQLWRRGVPVVAVCQHGDEVGLCLEGGITRRFPRRRLGERVDLLADELAAHLPHRAVLDVPADPRLVPEIGMRTLAWWEFLRSEAHREWES